MLSTHPSYFILAFQHLIVVLLRIFIHLLFYPLYSSLFTFFLFIFDPFMTIVSSPVFRRHIGDGAGAGRCCGSPSTHIFYDQPFYWLGRFCLLASMHRSFFTHN